jgi:sterol desaturase/sphingolipid hydroxylase (fatty acid hydroxylase superfamily)
MPLYLRFYLWLLLISAVIMTLEWLFPWRSKREPRRDDLYEDLFWMLFNTQFLSWMLAIIAVHLASLLNQTVLHLGLPTPESIRLISHWPWWVQIVVFFVIKDFIEWNVHRWLHVVPWLWKLHQLHHSSENLGWASTFRSHWGEIALYKVCVYLPLVVLGVDSKVIFGLLVFSLVIQELAHANLNWDWGLFRYVLNSPRFHAWHHAVETHGRGGQNFAVNLTLWDWLFRTVYWPANKVSPQKYGFEGLSDYPKSIRGRLMHPLSRQTRPRSQPS